LTCKKLTGWAFKLVTEIRMISAASFLDHLYRLGFSQYAGVPCSFLKPLLNYVIDYPVFDYIAATSEGEAVGINLGAYLGGKKTVTMCQNSGLGNMVNPLTSLNAPFRVPTLIIVTWRGKPGLSDEPQHVQMGRITHRLLETLEIPWLAFPTEEGDIASTIQTAAMSMAKNGQPFALVMEKGAVASYELQSLEKSPQICPEHQDFSGRPYTERLSRLEALQAILETLPGQEAIIATTGKTGRELFTLADRPNHLYVVGGMGTASAIGFGVARATPEQPVVVLDGDGAALMKMGNFATIGFYKPSNLLHILLNNEVYDSTGGQNTAAICTDFGAVAAAANYRHVLTVDSLPAIRSGLGYLGDRPGPSLLHIKIKAGSLKNLGRPTLKPHEVKERFMAFLKDGRNQQEQA
jgi:phosphonopyruvate decarboxylase